MKESGGQTSGRSAVHVFDRRSERGNEPEGERKGGESIKKAIIENSGINSLREKTRRAERPRSDRAGRLIRTDRKTDKKTGRLINRLTRRQRQKGKLKSISLIQSMTTKGT